MPKKANNAPTPEKKPKHPGGRPTKYSPEMAEKICRAVATTTDGLKTMCNKRPDLPNADTVREWRYLYPEFSGKYAQAKMIQADLLAEDCIDIADDSSNDIKINDEGYETFNGEFAARSRIRIDTRKWMASKLLPKQYGGDKELQDEKDKNEKLKEEIRQLRSELDAQNKRDY